ncbi:phosphatidate cytidylyltransferase [Clostridium sediminicola]|uniref:phosphatidate cytidylyltransferase n=1 Tax=Clostridium sediminicola TaxID=3114879 RepID=UPI0031F211ED
MNKRYIGVLILSPLVIVLFLGGIYLKILTALFALMGMYEFYSILNNKKINPVKYLGYSICIFYYLLIFIDKMELIWISSIFIWGLLIAMSIMVLSEEYNIVDISLTIIGCLYVTIPFSLIALISEKNNGNYFVWIIFISCWMCDSMAYYSGKYFGKTKLCPRVSPKKTVEGAIGGLLGSIITVTAFGLFMQSRGINIATFNFILLGFFGGVICQIGDLAASSIKRYVGVKDYSNIIPGHGGILDRFDSILFTSVLVYYYVTIILGM